LKFDYGQRVIYVKAHAFCEFQGHHSNQAYYKSGIISPEYQISPGVLAKTLSANQYLPEILKSNLFYFGIDRDFLPLSDLPTLFKNSEEINERIPGSIFFIYTFTTG
jgi:hypothetical protein